MRPSFWPALGALAAALLLTAAPFLAPHPWGATMAAPTPSSRFATSPLASNVNGNFSAVLPQMPVSLPPGSALVAQYGLRVPSYTPSLGTVSVSVPQVAVTFWTTLGPVKEFVTPTIVAITSAAPTYNENTSSVALIENVSALTANRTASASTQNLALSTPLTFGRVVVSMQWQWRAALPDGSQVVSAWSPANLIQPAQWVQVTGAGPAQISAGSSFTVCLAGPVGGRTFALHAQTLGPVTDVAQSIAPVPAATPLPYCWGVTIPASLTPQPMVVQLWNYDAVSFLLALYKVTLTNQSGPTGGGSAGGPIGGATLPIDILVAVVAAALVAFLLVRHLLFRGSRQSAGTASSIPAPQIAHSPEGRPASDASAPIATEVGDAVQP